MLYKIAFLLLNLSICGFAKFKHCNESVTVKSICRLTNDEYDSGQWDQILCTFLTKLNNFRFLN